MADNEKKLEDMFGTNASGSTKKSGKKNKPAKTSTEDKKSAVTGREKTKKSRKEKGSKSPKGEKQESAAVTAEDKRAYSPIRKSREMKLGCLGGLMYFVFVMSVSVILACLAWMAASDVLALNKASITSVVELSDDIFTAETVEVTDDEGNVTTKTVTYADIDAVADILEAEGLIEYKSLFKFYCTISNASNKIAAGSYELSTDYDYRALVKKMNQYSGAAVTVEVMFPEGFTMQQIFERLEENKVASVDDLMEAAKNFSYNYSFLNAEELGNAGRLEGYLFPDTYEFYAYMEPSSAINKFLDNFNRRVTDDMEAQATAMGRTLDEIIVIASLIEKEAGCNDERDEIASVIYNRLKSDMPLQIDATIVYATGREEITADDLQYDSPFNTYLNKGLPPEPICNPGLASIKAALNPANTSYYYYALDTSTMTHKFFRNYNEHAAFVATQNYG